MTVASALARAAALTFAVIAAVSLGSASSAQTGERSMATVKVSISIKVNTSQTTLKGKVRSAKGACYKKVAVKVYWTAPGGNTSSAMQFGEVSTNSKGKYSIEWPEGKLPEGKYYVRNDKSVVPGECKGVQSKVLTVEY